MVPANTRGWVTLMWENEQYWISSTACFNAWAEKWIRPVYEFLYTVKAREAEASRQQALQHMSESALPDHVTEALEYRLEFLRWHIQWIDDDSSWTQQCFELAREFLLAPDKTAFGERERLTCWMIMYNNADIDHFTELTAEQIEEVLNHLEEVPELESIWHNIADWAFRHRHIDLLERAFGAHTVNPSRLMGSAKWLRINLMYQLVAGKATTRDVEETLRSLQIIPQLREFCDQIWPVCVAQGLINPYIEALLAERFAEIDRDGKLPRPEPKTKSMRTQLPG
jgi:hypothetical protein